MPPDESLRLATLHSLYLLDKPPDERFDRITRTALRLFNVPMALITLVDSSRDWFCSRQGLSISESPRDVSFSAQAILQDNIFVIPDASQDARFAANPLVAGEPHIRFYAGRPLSAEDGSKLGTLCLLDTQPRQLTEADLYALDDLACWAEAELNPAKLNPTPQTDSQDAPIPDTAPVILLAEDNPVNQKLTIMQLRKLGYNVESAINGLEVVGVAARRNCTAILMDCQMPELDGFEATRLIRRAELENGQHVPIIAMTANTMSQDRRECLNAGMDDYLPKPVRLDQLQAMLTQWVRSGERQRAAGQVVPADLDAMALRNLRLLSQDGDHGFMRILIQDFLANATGLLAAMRAAVTNQDANAMNRAAHTLKSSSANYGATALSALCREMEMAARLGDLSAAAIRFQRIEIEFARVKLALELVRGGKQSADE